MTQEHRIPKVADAVADALDADVILYNGPISRPQDSHLIDACVRRRRRTNALLMLVTMGGDPDAAYRVARCIQTKYDHFVMYVSGCCKSAGTLVATGAHELVFSDHGELGPLDVQIPREGELVRKHSGLAMGDTLTVLHGRAFDAFEGFFLNIMKRGGQSISTGTATRIAVDLTGKLFAQLYGQLEPLRIGESVRALSVAYHYGELLLREGRNITPESLAVITSEYPSHGFVIDRAEAETLFHKVREPSPEEAELARALEHLALSETPVEHGQLCFKFLSTETPTEQDALVGNNLEGGADAREPGSPEEAEAGKAAEKKTRQLAKVSTEKKAVAGAVTTVGDTAAKPGGT